MTRLIPRRGWLREMARRYAFPCRGYWSSVAKDNLPPDVITGDSTADSFNWLVSATERHLVRRRGIVYLGESDVTAQVGLLESVTKNLSMNMTCRHMLDVQYPSATPGSIVGPTALYTDQADTGHFGQLYVNTSTQGTRKVLGHEMGTLASPGTTHYRRAVARVRPDFRMVPLPCLAGGSGTQAVLYNRCTFPLMRALLAGGAMKMIQARGQVFWGSLHGCPAKWDQRSNPSTSTGSEQVHVGPWGHLTPLPLFSVATTASTGLNDKTWWDGDQFYLAFVFQNEDGSFSAPTQCRPVNAVLTSGRGLVTVGSTSGTSSYSNLRYLLPIGPPGTAARLICRTRKTNVSTAVTRPAGMTPQGATSDIDAGGRKLYVVDIVRDNVTKFYYDSRSNDDQSLLDDPNAVNPFYVWPLPSRYCGEAERRAVVGYTRKQHPCAIQLAPVGGDRPYVLEDGSTPTAQGTPSEGSGIGATGFGPYGDYAACWRLYQDTAGAMTLLLRYAQIPAVTITNDLNYAIGAGDTVQDIIDRINNTTLGDTAGWAAEPVPGTDPGIFATNLAPSVFDVASCTLGTNSTITVGSSGFSDVAIGHRVKVQSGTGTVPANTVVIGKASDGSITIGDENGTAVNATAGTATLRFWSDCGDDSWSNTAATWDVGNVRSYLGSFPAVIALRGAYLDKLGFDKQGLMFTGSSPGAAQQAPQNFFNQPANRGSAPSDAGVFMGTAPIFPSPIAFYSEGIFALRNTRDFNTGVDQDYHLFRLTPKGLGCIQYGTIAWANGWAGCLTREGYLVTDGMRYHIISNALLDPARATGILAYQAMSLASQQGSADLPQYQTAHALVVDGVLRLSVKPNAAIA